MLGKVVTWCRRLAAMPPTFRAGVGPALVLALIVFGRSPASNAIFDEQEAMLANPYVQGQLGWGELFSRDFWGLPPERTIGSYRPLPNLFWRILWWPVESTFVLHLLNVVVHGVTAALLASFTWHVTRSRAVAWLSGAAFLSSAVLTEAVTGVVGLADLLSCFAAVLALQSLRGRLVPMFAGVGLSIFVGFLSKESVLGVVPLVGVAALVTAPSLHPERPRALGRALMATAATLSALVAYTYFRRTFFPVAAPEFPPPETAFDEARQAFLSWFRQPKMPSDPVNNPLVEATVEQRIWGGLRVFASTLGQAVLPVNLSGDYSMPQEPIPKGVPPRAIVGGIALVGLPLAGLGTFVLARFWARQRTAANELHFWGDRVNRVALASLVALALIWIPVTYFPHSNLPALLPTVRAERFWALPAIGMAWLVGVGGALAVARRRRFEYVVAFFFGFHLLQARTHALHYSDDLVFWRATRISSPRSAKAHLNYGVMVGARGDLPRRVKAGARALELAPTWPMASIYQGDALCRLDRIPEAWQHYRRGFELDPTSQSLSALALQCLWDHHAVDNYRGELREFSNRHPGTWLAYLIDDVLEQGEQQGGVSPRYRPRGYDEGPRRSPSE